MFAEVPGQFARSTSIPRTSYTQIVQSGPIHQPRVAGRGKAHYTKETLVLHVDVGITHEREGERERERGRLKCMIVHACVCGHTCCSRWYLISSIPKPKKQFKDSTAFLWPYRAIIKSFCDPAWLLVCDFRATRAWAKVHRQVQKRFVY